MLCIHPVAPASLLQLTFAATVALSAFGGRALIAAETGSGKSASPRLERELAEEVLPFLHRYCTDCHGSDLPEAKLDLSPYTSIESVERHHQTWQEVRHRLEAGEMPPEDADQPAAEKRQRVMRWIDEVRREAALRNAGDPGPVVTRRLSNAEYNYTIRDLTGVDLRPTRDFPVDPANEAGFDNSGESLAMSPALLEKYLGAARSIAEHLVLKLDGFTFAPHPVMTETDRDKYAVRRIVDFYQRQPTDLADYFYAAWTFKVDGRSARSAKSLDQIAVEHRVSPRYLHRVWSMLDGDAPVLGPLATARRLWRALPGDADHAADARRGCEAMRASVVENRQRLEPTFPNLKLEGGHLGSQQFVLWKNDQYAAHRRLFVPETIADVTEGSEEADKFPDLVAPQDPADRALFEESLRQFCDLFPDAFYVSERGRDYVGRARDQQEKGRLLSAGFHSMMGYYRDDAPLHEMILDEAARDEIDTLWQELDFITAAPIRQYTGFVWFERTDSRYLRDEVFDFARAEDKQVTSEPMIGRLATEYLAKAERNGGSQEVMHSIETYFDRMNQRIRWVEQARVDARDSHLDALLAFAARAYRRPLTDAERRELVNFYHSLRNEDQLDHEESIQDCVVAILMSPEFCYRMDLVPTEDQQRPLSDLELASRLSFFLWSSMPDAELTDLAVAGRLGDREVLVAQARRMLRDDRAEALAVEFGGNWLDFRRFEQHNSVDRERFPEFTDSLRTAMFLEPIRFFVDLLRRDAPVSEFLQADHTFVNAELAKHYGITSLDFGHDPADDDWRRVDHAGEFGRGGLLPMAVFQTVNSPGLRTSPVKRGYWVARRLLGERIPPPPPDVPELPEDEKDLGELTLAATLARHREHTSCAACHDRFDSLGLVFENYGPVGQWRTIDLADRPVESHAEFPGGMRGEGLDGLLMYIDAYRRGDFVDNLCRKLLSYGLGRSLRLSDDPLVERMKERLQADDHRLSSLVTSIVTSTQFLEKRGRHHE